MAHCIDPECPISSIAKIHHSSKLGDCCYILNQTNTKTNRNKFFKLQILDVKSELYIYTRFGRTGLRGVSTCKRYDKDSAFKMFEDIFYDKTGITWVNRYDRDPLIGKFVWIQTTESITDEQSERSITKYDIKTSHIDSKIYHLIDKLSSQDLITSTLKSNNFDSEKMPLGALGITQVTQGRLILTKIKSLIDTESDDIDMFESLSSQYYSIVPCNFGKEKRLPNIDILDRYEELNCNLDALEDIIMAGDVIKLSKSADSSINPIDAIYNSLGVKLSMIDDDSEIFDIIKSWMRNTRGSTHSYKSMTPSIIYEVHSTNKIYESKFGHYTNKTLLWHGTRMINILNIFKNGLIIKPSWSSHCGSAFGDGLYFANSSSKSANYCRDGGDIILLIYEVALGNMCSSTSGNFKVDKDITNGEYDSMHGVGKQTCDPDKDIYIDDVKIPIGPLIKTQNSGYLEYDEFIVYDKDQVHLRYVVQL
jgi:poly [ADP-ribose] polymerase 2/3/4